LLFAFAFTFPTFLDRCLLGTLGLPNAFVLAMASSEDRFSRYYCNKCGKEYPGCPLIRYENPNEELGEEVILIEKGEYDCKICNNIIALYRKFNREK
jgi:hypothetical protein